MRKVTFDSRTKDTDGLYGDGTWYPAGTLVRPRAIAPRPIDPAYLQFALQMQSHRTPKPGPFNRLWERNEAYLEDPSLFRPKYRPDFDTPADQADVKIPAMHGRTPGKSILRAPQPPTPLNQSKGGDDLSAFLRRLNIKIARTF